MPSPWRRIGWRNLGRNGRRTLFTASGLALGYFGVVLLAGVSDGMVAEMINNGTGILSGQIQVHAKGYLPERSLYTTIPETGPLRTVGADPAVAAVAPRIYGTGLVSRGDATVGAMLVGVDPARERHVSRLLDAITSGRAPRAGTNELVIGTEMARQLKVQPGDTLVLVAPAADGTLGNDLFVLSGVFHSGLTDIDRAYGILPIDVLRNLLVLPPDRVHEIAARTPDPWSAPAAAGRLQSTLGRADSAAVEDWTTFRPEMLDYARLTAASEWIMLAIVFFMALFGVVNTLLMATFERRREFALLLALGAEPKGIVRAVIWEALSLGALGLVTGAVVTVPVLIWWHHAPPDLSGFLSGFTMAGALIRPVLRVEYPWLMTGVAAVALLLMAVAAAAYPAWRAARIPPADTLTGR